jgi:hypothetical protein
MPYKDSRDTQNVGIENSIIETSSLCSWHVVSLFHLDMQLLLQCNELSRFKEDNIIQVAHLFWLWGVVVWPASPLSDSNPVPVCQDPRSDPDELLLQDRYSVRGSPCYYVGSLGQLQHLKYSCTAEKLLNDFTTQLKWQTENNSLRHLRQLNVNRA